MIDLAEQSRKTMQGLIGLVERITPWLVEVGSWVFGGLIALNLVVIAALITVGPVDRAVVIAVAALAIALPLDVTGIVLLRLIKDVADVRIDELTLDAFREVRFPHIDAYFPSPHERASLAKRRARIVLAYAAAAAALSVTLTLAGIGGALWHMAPWVAELFAATVVLSSGLLLVVLAHSLPRESEAEKELKRQYREERSGHRLRQATPTEENQMTEPTITQTRGTFSLACRVSVNLHASAERIWGVLTDAADFPRWNSTVSRIEGEIREGGKLRIHVPGTDRTFTPTISGVVRNERMTWIGGVSPVFKGVRTFELHSRDDGSTDFIMAERFSGLILPFVKRTMPDFGPVFARYANDLRREVEQQ